ncbi:hypothetical protein [Modestobacter marinus]|uniref:hypothetical protein n=1 Tax=Modestobacter marinus TaxID=477641 RepID=UPI001C93D0CB|nr:hypothetical protein [Modestobacter marinus]
MDGPRRSSRQRRGRARLARAALVAVLALVGLLAVPGTASAAPGDGTITPVLDCLRQNPDGTYTAVLGYTNSARSTEPIPVGTWNTISPAKYNGGQPTSFVSGTRHGAFSVTLTKSEYMGGPSWYLDGKFVFFGWAWTNGVTTCPPSTELPEEGNGTGPAIAVAVAGLVGAFAVHRARRRALAGVGAPVRDGGDDA